MNKITILYRQYGLRFIFRILKSVANRVGLLYETLYYYEKELCIEDIEQKLSNYDYSDVRELTLTDFDRCNYLDKKKKALYKERLESGKYTALGIIKDNILVYYSWISFKEVGLPFGFKKTIPLSNSEALLEDSFCDPKYRGRGYHGKVNILRLKKILEAKKYKAIVIVLKGNKPAIKVQLKSGFIKVKQVNLIKIFNKKYIKIKDTNV